MCSKNSVWAHARRKNACVKCGGSGLCRAAKCETYDNPKYKGHCIRCFVHLLPSGKNALNYKTKGDGCRDAPERKVPRHHLSSVQAGSRCVLLENAGHVLGYGQSRHDH